MTIYTDEGDWVDQATYIDQAAHQEFQRRIRQVSGVFTAFGCEEITTPEHHRSGAVMINLMSPQRELFQITVEETTGSVSWVWNTTANRLGKLTDLIPDDQLINVLDALREGTTQAIQHERRVMVTAAQTWNRLRREQLADARQGDGRDSDASPPQKGTSMPARAEQPRPSNEADQTASPSKTADHAAVPRVEVLAVLRDSHAWYRASAEGSWVPDYLNRRNLYGQMKPAGLGYAPPGFRTTLDHLRAKGHSDEAIEAAGMAVRSRKNDQLYDVFRDRLMFPITEPGSRTVVGFTGRVGEGADPDLPKYWNTHETDVFRKRELLYALGEDRDELVAGNLPIFVEGPTDRLALREGRRDLPVTGLSPLGTALTSEQVRLVTDLIGKDREVGFAFDPDTAGRKALLRVWDIATAEGLQHTSMISLPDGKDPAELIRAGRSNLLREAIEARRPLLYAVTDVRLEAHSGASSESSAYRLAAAEHAMKQDLHRIPGDRVGDYVAYIARKLDLDAESVTAQAVEVVAQGPDRPQQAGQLDQEPTATDAQNSAHLRTETSQAKTSRAR